MPRASRRSVSRELSALLELDVQPDTGIARLLLCVNDPTNKEGEAMNTIIRSRGILACAVLVCLCGVGLFRARVLADDGHRGQRGWPQWGQNPQHAGAIDVEGQALDRQLADLVFDPFVRQEQHDAGGDLLAHYQAPLTEGQDVFMEFKSGRWATCDDNGNPIPPDTACGSDAWNNQIWSERRLHWEDGSLVTKWTFASDWKPEPDGGNLGGWEPVFHGVLANGHVYVAGFGGTVWKIERGDGSAERLNPFDRALDANTFVSGPLSADDDGNIYYNVLKLDSGDPWAFGPSFNGIGGPDIPDAWLVTISNEGTIRKVSYKALGYGPQPTDLCNAAFGTSTLPWPPSPTAKPRQVPCLSQRPGVNITPAIAPDGTIYSVTVSHNLFSSRYSFVVAINPDLTLKWAASMRDRLHDGCNNDAGNFPGALLPKNGTPGGCRAGANPGVDPATNEAPAGRVIDQSSSSPVVAPDGSVLYGSYTRYNYARGQLFRFSASGEFMAAYDFGWDSTPAILTRGEFDDDATPRFSVVIKDNHYDVGSYCNSGTLCPPAPRGPYYITQLKGSDLSPEWSFKGTETRRCSRDASGQITCVDDGQHPNGFEWCINAPAIDAHGVVYANSEDGNLYAIPQGHHGVFKTPKGRLFLNQAIGAAYTPLSLGRDGKIYTENDGHLFVVGENKDQ